MAGICIVVSTLLHTNLLHITMSSIHCHNIRTYIARILKQDKYFTHLVLFWLQNSQLTELDWGRLQDILDPTVLFEIKSFHVKPFPLTWINPRVSCFYVSEWYFVNILLYVFLTIKLCILKNGRLFYMYFF